MFKSLSKFPEWHVVGFLSIIALSWYLLSIFSYLLGYISDILIVVILSWIFAFIIEPLVEILIKRGLSRLTSTSLTFIGIAIALVAFLVIVLPQTVNQLSQLSTARVLHRFRTRGSGITLRYQTQARRPCQSLAGGSVVPRRNDRHAGAVRRVLHSR
jgi:predicted PurR-regulated permease PerM